MSIPSFFRNALKAVFMLTTLSIVGCVDNDYKLSEIDKTIGLGGDITLPSDNSTQDICLNDVLDLASNNFLAISEDGNYNIDVADDNSFSAHMVVPVVNLPSKTYKGTYTINLGDFGGAQANRRVKKADDEITFNAPMVDMDYSYSYKSSNITSLEYVGIEEGKLTVTLSFSQELQACLSNIQSMVFSFPKCLVCGKAGFRGDSIATVDNVLTLHDISPAEGVKFALNLEAIDLSKTMSDGSYMRYVKGTGFDFHGSLNIGVVVRESAVDFDKVAESRDLTVSGTAVLSKMRAKDARGAFTPTRSFGKVGGVSLRNIPSFLRDEETNLDLYDPQLNLNIYSEVPMPTNMTGAIVSKDNNGNVIHRIDVPSFKYKANGNSVISVRRRPSANSGDTTIVVIPSICDVIRHLPDSIALIDLKGVGDDSETTNIVLGSYYKTEIRLSIASGISLADDAQIIYKRQYKGWNDKVRDFSFVETTVDGQKTIDGYLKVTANVSNKIPAFLVLDAYGIDTQGNALGADRLEVEVQDVIKASADGVTPANSEMTIIVRPKDNEVFKVLDGLAFKVMMKTKNGSQKVTGVKLNAYKQSLKVTDIKVKKYGKMAADLN